MKVLPTVADAAPGSRKSDPRGYSMIRPVSVFPGGSAWAMARDIADGFLQVTARSFGRMNASQVDQVVTEINRRLRDVRGEQPNLHDIQALRKRNMRIQRLNGALTVARGLRQKRRS